MLQRARNSVESHYPLRNIKSGVLCYVAGSATRLGFSCGKVMQGCSKLPASRERSRSEDFLAWSVRSHLHTWDKLTVQPWRGRRFWMYPLFSFSMVLPHTVRSVGVVCLGIHVQRQPPGTCLVWGHFVCRRCATRGGSQLEPTRAETLFFRLPVGAPLEPDVQYAFSSTLPETLTNKTGRVAERCSQRGKRANTRPVSPR